MSRTSAFRNTWAPNRRPYLTLAPDSYISVQGETTVIGCGECRREIDFNRYLTAVSTDTSVDSPPGSATIQLSIPDTDVNDFYANGVFLIIPMMEIEVFMKGYYTVGGTPQYYKTFWGMVSSVTKSWSNGVTSINISCKDILRWWELTNVTINPAFLDPIGGSAGNFQFWGNKFAGANPYTVIISLAKDAMGDFSLTTNSFVQYRPELGPESRVIGEYTKDIMAYWQIKFGSFWNSLVLYGSSGQAYTVSSQKNLSPYEISKAIFEEESLLSTINSQTSKFQNRPDEIAVFRKQLTKAADVEFMQTETRSKLSVALEARDQAGNFEFYCDSTGDIIFKPPFYNLNVIPNKPVSWIQDFEIIDDSVTESEAEVITHITTSGNAYGGVMDYGLNDEIVTPRTGVFDYHLLKRYGWRRMDYQCEWCGNPQKAFFHILDVMDRINAKRSYGSMTIPLRPELRVGFPVWIPKYDSFFYVQSLSHNFSIGGQATTTVNLTAKRSKFIAPRNIGRITSSGNFVDATGKVKRDKGIDGKKQKKEDKKDVFLEPAYKIEFPSKGGQTTGKGEQLQEAERSVDDPIIMRHPQTGQLLGYPNVVMVYRSTINGEKLTTVLAKTAHRQQSNPKKQSTSTADGTDNVYNKIQKEVQELQEEMNKSELLARLRAGRYEAAMTSLGAYDYAQDFNNKFKELSVVPSDSVTWGVGTDNPDSAVQNTEENKKIRVDLGAQQKTLEKELTVLKQKLVVVKRKHAQALRDFRAKLNRTTDQAIIVKRQIAATLKKKIIELKAKVAKLKRELALKEQKVNKTNAALLQAEANFNSVEPLGPSGVKAENALTEAEASAQTALDERFESAANLLNALQTLAVDETEFTKVQEELDAITASGTTTTADEEVSVAQKLVNDKQAQIDKIKTRLANFRVLPSLNVLVRPVSDEFGFEVIGHYRYGRGAFIDAGKVQVKIGTNENEQIANRLGIQFAASGALIENMPDANVVGMSPEIMNFAESFEKLRPTDWETGVSFKGSSNADENLLSDVNMTGQRTYQESLRQSSNNSTIVFTEADATRKAITLAELKPTINNGAISEAVGNCNCWLNKTNWLSVFPQSFIDSIMNPTGFRTGSTALIPPTSDSPAGTPSTLRSGQPEFFQISVGDSGSTGVFFQKLNEFLLTKFQTEYDENLYRETYETKSSRDVFAPADIQTNNVIPDPAGSMFQRASQGDTNALDALQREANFNFGISDDAKKKFAAEAEAQAAKLKSLSFTPGGSNPLEITTATPDEQKLKDVQELIPKQQDAVKSAERLLAQFPDNVLFQQTLEKAKTDLASLIAQRNILQAKINKNREVLPGTPLQPTNTTANPVVFNAAKAAAALENAQINAGIVPNRVDTNKP